MTTATQKVNGREQRPRAARTYGASPIKRSRRTRAAIESLCDSIFEIVQANRPMTVRQLFYQMVTRDLIPKKETEYKNTAGRLLLKMRREGRVPFSWVTDSTRWMRKPASYSSLEEALERTARLYRRNLWDFQEAYCEVWCEKDAIAGVLLEETRKWDVPLMVSKGFSSATYLYEAAEAIKNAGKPAHLYYFGDRDPSGVHIDRRIEKDLRTFAPEAEIHFRRVAVLPEQIEAWNLPTRPTKKTDSRSKDFEGDSVELDAIPPLQLRQLVRGCIEQHVDMRAKIALEVAERSERDLLYAFAREAGERAEVDAGLEDLGEPEQEGGEAS